MKYQIEYIYGNLHDEKSGIVTVDAVIPKDSTAAEQNEIFKPLIAKKTGHFDIKIMSYEEI
ncbi:hypothetical protein J1907_17730 [Lysinibacillus sphaericus]|uniref:hypothetical protein n=1 Tax=Lysinibacillus sphaericus TaxID=1421 RepID=UPI00055E2214|nr:hypothetical protein [Lysinibacillus sphaericus]QTB21566.1 hypothetical protein J1907_17730 [Lysinibacillus sphaericus]